MNYDGVDKDMEEAGFSFEDTDLDDEDDLLGDDIDSSADDDLLDLDLEDGSADDLL